MINLVTCALLTAWWISQDAWKKLIYNCHRVIFAIKLLAKIKGNKDIFAYMVSDETQSKELPDVKSLQN